MSVEISPPFRVFTDVDGEPLEDGYIYIGAVNQNPQAVPVQVYWDEALTIPAAQPIRTLGGYPSRSGTPSRMYVVGSYSISVSNKNNTLVYSDLDNRSGSAGLRQDLSSAAAGDGDELVAYIQTGLNATARTVHDKFLDFAVSLDDFYQVADGDDYTPAAIRANAASLAIMFPPRTIHLQNWEPLENTVIYAFGSRVNRLNDTPFSTTVAAGAIVANAPGLVIFGGEWGLGTGSTALVWTGSILLQSGSLRVIGARFVETWGGINGAENQNGALDMTNLTIQDCEFDGCAHNTYIADCQTFSFVGNESKNSTRDGLRLYRNVQNFLIVGNHIHDNGDGTPAQSQDAIDIFYGGNYGIITGNFLYNNVSQGVDIKRSPLPVGETSFSNYVIVTNNHIYGNGFSGVSIFMGLSPVEYNLSYNISNNHIHDNQSYGIIGLYGRDLAVINNHIYNNGLTGARFENCVDYSVVDNHVYNNGLLLSGGLRMGIHCLADNVNGHVTGNDVHPGGLTNQIDGIWFLGTGNCHDNNSRDHTSLNYNCDANLTQRGKTYSTKIGNNTNTQLLAIASKGCFAGARIAVNNTLIADVLVQKRNATTGGSATTLATQTALNNPTSYTAAIVASAATAATRNVAGGEMLTTTLLNITSAFTDGILEVHYID